MRLEALTYYFFPPLSSLLLSLFLLLFFSLPPQPLPAGATLIISPESIVQQWEEEIQKHTQPGALRVLVRNMKYFEHHTLAENIS